MRDLPLARWLSRDVAALLFVVAAAFVSPASAQSIRPRIETSFEPESAPFGIGEDLRVEASLEPFRFSHDDASANRELWELLNPFGAVDRQWYSLAALDRSASLVQSLATFRAGRSQEAAWFNDETRRLFDANTRLSSEAGLLSAIESYSHTPLRMQDVSAGLDELRSVQLQPTLPPRIKSEIFFWRAEGERALGFLNEASNDYLTAYRASEDRSISSVAQFRLAELEERLGDYSKAESDFSAVRRTAGSPLQLLASLRLASLMRTRGESQSVLRELVTTDSLSTALEHRVEHSARELGIISALVQQLMLERTEANRIVGSFRPAEAQDEPRVPQLVSEYFASEVALVRGSALSELGRYDSASDVLTDAIQSLEHSAGNSSAQRDFVLDALRFERAWAEFRQSHYHAAADEFVALAQLDTTSRRMISGSGNVTLREQGRYADPFYESYDTIRTAVLDNSLLSHNTLDTSFFIYNDFPERSRFYAGVALARSGDIRKAEKLFVGLIQDRSIIYSSRANYQLGLLQFASNHPVEASSILAPLASEASLTGGFSALLMGEMAYRKNQYESAERYFRYALNWIPDSMQSVRALALVERGLSLVALGEWELANRDLSAYVATHPATRQGVTDEAYFWLGRSYFWLGALDSAEAEFVRVRTLFPSSPRAIDVEYQYAWTLFRKNDFRNAERSFERVIALDSITRYAYDAQARAGDSWYAVGDYERAATQYNLAVDRPAFNNARTARALYQLGLTRMRLDSARSAMNIFHTMLRKFPTSELADRAMFNAALAAYAIDQPSYAEADVAKLVHDLPSSPFAPKALLVTGDERIDAERYEPAIASYRTIVQQYPQSAEALPALFRLQDAYLHLKQSANAFAAADSALANPKFDAPRSAILLRTAELEYTIGDWKSATLASRKLLAEHPAAALVAQTKYLLANSLMNAGDSNTAATTFAEIISDRTTTHSSVSSIDRYTIDEAAAESHLELARLAVRANKFDTARAEYTRAIAEEFFSTEAAPKTLAEFAEFYVARNQKDSAIRLLHEIADRYSLQTRAGARAEIRAAKLIEELGRKQEAQAVLLRVAEARNDMLGGAARVRLGELYLHDTTWHLALAEFAKAETKSTLAPESQIRRLFGVAQASIALHQKPQAIGALRSLLREESLSDSDRTRAANMLAELQPAKKDMKKSKVPATRKPAKHK